MELLPKWAKLSICASLLFVALPASALQGDVNGDGEVNTADVSAIYTEILNPTLTYFNSACDINGDREINAADVSALYEIILNGGSVDNEDDKFADCYATLRSEQKIDVITDASYTNFLRQLWNLNELPTDEALCTWADPGLKELIYGHWGSDLQQAWGLWARLCTSINICNDYLSNADRHDDQHNAEVRFLRAMYYYYFIDLFGNAPCSETKDLLTEAPMLSRVDLFSYIENELKAIESDLAEPRQNEYGRVDKAAAWLLLGRLYLNAEVYTDTPRWSDAKTYAKKVIDSDYSLVSDAVNGYSAYQSLFMGDNDTNGAQNEILLPIVYDGSAVKDWSNTWEYSGMTFLIAATFDYNMIDNYSNGLTQYWGGLHARETFSRAFGLGNSQMSPADNVAIHGDRAMFYSLDNSIYNENLSSFSDGFGYPKFLNIKAQGDASEKTEFARTDFPLLRAAEAYLTFAEADVRITGNPTSTDALATLNILLSRSNDSFVRRATLNTILSEWMKEFGFEAHRRTDLIRFNYFGGEHSKNWPWRGGEYAGTAFDLTRNLYPIPAQALTMNPNLTQNPGYDVEFDRFYLTVKGNYDLSSTDNLTVQWTELDVKDYIANPTYHVEISPDGSFNNPVNMSNIEYFTYEHGDYVRFDDVKGDLSYDITPDKLRQIVKWYVKTAGGEVTDDHRFLIRVVADANGIGTKTTTAVLILLRNYPTLINEQWWITSEGIGDSGMSRSGIPPYNKSVAPMVRENDESNIVVYASYFEEGENIILYDNDALTTSTGHAIYGGDTYGGYNYTSVVNVLAYNGIAVRASGYYKLSLDLDSHKLTFTGIDVPTSYNYICLPGYYNNWSVEDTSVRMTRYDFSRDDANSHSWCGHITITDGSYSSSGEFKFAANGEWYTNWGSTSYPMGTGVQNGQNIPIPAVGSYYIFFNDILGTYFIMEDN